MTSTPEERLKALGLALPEAPAPVANYVPAARSGALLHISGQLPKDDTGIAVTGRLGEEVSLEDGQRAARLCALNGLAQMAAAGGGLSAVRQVVKIGVFVASAPGFTEQPQVANGASDLLVEVLGDAGRHARSAVGVAALPLGAAVEVEFVVELA